MGRADDGVYKLTVYSEQTWVVGYTSEFVRPHPCAFTFLLPIITEGFLDSISFLQNGEKEKHTPHLPGFRIVYVHVSWRGCECALCLLKAFCGSTRTVKISKLQEE